MKLRRRVDRSGVLRSAHILRKSRFALALAAAAVPLAAADRAYATTKTYSGSFSGNWSTLTWAPVGQPANGDDVWLRPASGNITVTYDAGAPSIATSLASLTIDVTNAASITFSQGLGNLAITGAEYVGYTGTGSLNLTGGTHTVSGQINFGYLGGSSGSGTLSGSGVLTSSATTIGYYGTGSFLQSGGTHTVNSLFLGYTSVGTNLSSGRYTMTSGILNANSEYVSHAGNGTFNQSGGINTASNLYIGNLSNGTASGTYSMSNGASLAVTNDFFVGNAGRGTFNLTGGNATATSGIFLGYSLSGAGTVNLSGGTLFDNGASFIGYSGTGVFNQSGGTHTVNSALFLGYNSGSVGSYTLGGAATLNVNGNELLGYDGAGTFTQNSGTHSVVSWLFLGYFTNSTAIYTLNSGTLKSAATSVGYFSGNNNVFNQTGGTFLANNGSFNGFLTIGDQQFSRGTYNITGIASQLLADNIHVGWAGSGTVNQSNGSVTLNEQLYLAHEASGVGVYNLSGGTLSAPVEVVGNSGTGTFNQTGGSNSLTWGSVSLANNLGATGAYNLSGGTLSAPQEDVGYNGNGTFNHTGGSNAVTTLNLGTFAGTNFTAFGTYNMTNGAALTVNTEYVGVSGKGVFNQAGGAHTINSDLYVGHNGGASGTFTLSGGVLNVQTFSTYVGNQGAGTFNQTGGSNNQGSWLYIGFGTSSIGTYNLSGGTLTAVAEVVGTAGSGTFNQTGGNNTVAWTGGPTEITIASNPGSTGSYNLSGGTLTATITNNGNFTQTGGTYNGTLTNNLNFTYGGGTFNGMLIQRVTGIFAFTPFGNFFTAIGGIVNRGTIPIGAGQTINGNGPGVDNEGGVITLAAGSLGGGPLLNNGTISGFGSITSSSLTNNAVIEQGAGNIALSRRDQPRVGPSASDLRCAACQCRFDPSQWCASCGIRRAGQYVEREPHGPWNDLRPVLQ